MTLTFEELQLVEQRLASESPKVGTAYLLAIFLGPLSGHRFYLGRVRSGLLMLVSWAVFIQPIWWLVDLIRLPAMVREERTKLRDSLIAEAERLKAMRASMGATPRVVAA